jgi:hypothetical protein
MLSILQDFTISSQPWSVLNEFNVPDCVYLQGKE